jgi:hypothetical protein
MKPAMRYLVSLAFLFSSIVCKGALANELNLCSRHGDTSPPVTSRVVAIRAGTISAGNAILLRSTSEDVCAAGKHCSVNGAPLIHAGTAGVELGRSRSWVCVGVAGTRPLDVWYGWVSAERWQRDAYQETSPKAWIGVWQNEDAKIKIQSGDGTNLDIVGNALWIGGAMGNAHFGDFQTSGTPQDGVISMGVGSEPGLCQIALRVMGHFLFAADNQSCGGMNVTFNGLYRFRHR